MKKPKPQPTADEMLDWIERTRADVLPHTHQDGRVEWLVTHASLLNSKIAWTKTIREAITKAMGRTR